MGTIIRTVNGNTTLFNEEVERKMNHYCNDHSQCLTPDKCDKTNVVLDAKAQQEFKVSTFVVINWKEILDRVC
jgi:hypothetical protein